MRSSLSEITKHIQRRNERSEQWKSPSTPQVNGQQGRVNFHCPTCDRDFTFTSPRAAHGAFANHARSCASKNGGEGQRGNSLSYNDGEEDSSSVSSVDVDEEVDLDQLKEGSRVVARCEKGQKWQATILGRHERDGVPGFYIHYKGLKKKSKRSDWDWVPGGSIVGLQE